jgi:glycine oxidase
MPNFDALIVGGGAIGLSLAWEMSRRGHRVAVVDRGDVGREASWAAAGMIPAGPDEHCLALATPLEQLAGLSQRLHPRWHQELREITGIDSGYQPTGGVELAMTLPEAGPLRAKVQRCRQLGMAVQTLDRGELIELEGELGRAAHRMQCAVYHAGEAQLRSPRWLRALVAACRENGVEFFSQSPVERWESSGRVLDAAVTRTQPISAAHYCLTAGCWTEQLAQQVGVPLPTRPIRGQMLLLESPPGAMRRHVCVGPRYLVPRTDGRVLVGSTEEEVGFEKGNTPDATDQLRRFATGLVAAAERWPLETVWSGLRAGTADGLPTIGRAPAFENLWLATGHYRGGIQLGPATAVLLADLIEQRRPAIDPADFDPARFVTAATRPAGQWSEESSPP